MIKTLSISLFAILIIMGCGTASSVNSTNAQDQQEDNSIQAKTANMKKAEGFLTYYHDEAEDNHQRETHGEYVQLRGRAGDNAQG